jgi:hypothetical protein
MLPGMPGWGEPPEPPDGGTPPDGGEPPEEEVILPDLASPGFWTWITYPTYSRPGFIQTSLITDPDHEKVPPTNGLPGEWIRVYNTAVGYTYAWAPTLTLSKKARTREKPKSRPKKHSD